MISRLIFLVFVFISFSAFAEEYSRSVDFSNLEENNTKEILTHFPIFKTNSFTKEDLDNLSRYLISKSLYDRVSITLNRENESEIFYIDAFKTKKINRIEIDGNFNITDNEISSNLNINKNESFDLQSLAEGIERIRLLYKSKGYHNAIIDAEYPSEQSNEINIYIKIKENNITEIKDIVFNSNNTELNKNVRSYLKNKFNLALTESNVAEIQKEAQSYFSRKGFYRAQLSSPIINLNDTESECELSFKIEKPEEYVFEFNGMDGISKSDLIQALNLENFISTSPSLSSEVSNKIKNYYISQGYTRSEVKTLNYDEVENKRTIFFDISEGPRIKIEEVVINGKYSEHIDYYIDFIRNNSSRLVKNGYYVKDDLENAYNALIIDRQNKGYLKAQIISTRVQYNKEKDKVKILINYNEGPITYVSQIQYEGVQNFKSDNLNQIIEITPNTPLKLKDLELGILKLKNFYRENGFLEMELLNEKENLVNYNEDNTMAYINFKVYEGPKVIVHNIVLEGNSFTKDYVILKELDFNIGDVLNPTKIEESINRLQRLGHFSTIDIKMLEQRTQVSNRTIVVKVNERDPGLFNMGIGLNSEHTLTTRGYLGLGYRNINGTGRGLSARLEGNYNLAEIKYLEHKTTLGYLEPYLLDTRIKGRVNGTVSRNITDFSTKEVSEVTQTTWSLEQDLTSHVTLIWDVLSIATVKDFKLDTDAASTTQVIGSTGPTLDFDFRDSPFNPTTGTFTRFNLEYSSPSLGSNATIEYIKSNASFTHYLPFNPNKWVWANSIRYGNLKNLSTLETGGVPYDKKGFTLGGRSTLRGFVAGTNEIFPNDSELGSAKYLLKGTSDFYLIKSELRIPIVNSIGVAIFYDGGEVNISDLELPYGYRDSVGFAFRYSTPFGAVNLEWAWKLKALADRNEDPMAFYFSIGTF